MNAEFARKEEKVKIKTAEETREKIEDEELDKKRDQQAHRDAWDAALEAKHVQELKNELHEERLAKKIEAKK